jgi:N6-adenosine-specific RNA methylase IME4
MTFAEGHPFHGLHYRAYDLVVLDVPWTFRTGPNGIRKSAQRHYTCMPDHEILALPVWELAAMPDCLLLCWAIWPKLPFALRCIERWGFTYKSCIVWHKLTRNGKDAMGPGFRVRGMNEPCLVATKGRPVHKPFEGSLFGERREHSRKPEEFYRLVEAYTPNLPRRCDVFARETHAGFDSAGNEKRKFDGAAA